MIGCEIAGVPADVAVTVTVLLPAGVPGLLGVLLPPPPHPGIHRTESAKTAMKLSSRMPRHVRLRFPVDSISPKKPGSNRA
jgi:hypothetical protein